MTRVRTILCALSLGVALAGAAVLPGPRPVAAMTAAAAADSLLPAAGAPAGGGDSLLTAAVRPDSVAPPPPAPAVAAATDSVPLPPGEIRGLAWMDGATLAVLLIEPEGGRAGRARLQIVDRAGAALDGLDVSGVLARGLAFDGEKFWSTGDDRDGTALLYRLDADTLRVEESFPLPGHRPTGLAWDGTFIWAVDRDGGSLERFDPRSGEVNGEGLAPAFSPTGLAWDGRLLWLSDAGTGRLYRLNRSLELVDVVAPEYFAMRGRDVALAWRGGTLWFAPALSGHAYELLLP